MISSNTSGSNGRAVWLMANGRSVSARSVSHCCRSTAAGCSTLPTLPRPPASHTDRRGQIHLMPGPERGADDRYVDAQQVAKRCFQHGVILSMFVTFGEWVLPGHHSGDQMICTTA